MSDNEKLDTFGSTEEDEIESLKYNTFKERKLKKPLSELRQPRQKYCPRWEKEFPWLRADKVDESLGVCIVCKKQLVCKKSHLERHEKSFKHNRLQNCTLVDLNTTNDPEFLECGKEEAESDGMEDEFASPLEMYAHRVDLEIKPLTRKDPVQKNEYRNLLSSPYRKDRPTSRMDRLKLLKRIDQDRKELNDCFYARRKGAPAFKQRDSFDLFFESVSASVKTLPPKLATEVKSRVSQLIAEFEMRAICEREAFETTQQSPTDSSIAVATSTHEITETTSGVPQIVYTFQPKYHD